MSDNLAEQAREVTVQIYDSLLEKLRHPDGKDTSYLRAMFRQSGGDYGCTISIEVKLNDFDKQAHIITKFGAAK